MRPYRLKTGEWLDLDHILSIEPPRLTERGIGYDAEVNIHFMFKSEPRVLCRHGATAWNYSEADAGGHRTILGENGPETTANGEPLAVHWLRTEIFEPLSEAWRATESQEELATLRQAAGRYAWLRKQHWTDNKLAVVQRPKDAIKLGHHFPSEERLDLLIDAAIEEEKKEAGQ